MNAISTSKELHDLLALSQETPFVIYKHSSTCPISASAQDRLAEGIEEGLLDPKQIYKLVVQTARDVSKEVEEELEVRHETPQVVVIKEGSAVYDTSHGDISAQELQEILEKCDE